MQLDSPELAVLQAWTTLRSLSLTACEALDADAGTSWYASDSHACDAGSTATLTRAAPRGSRTWAEYAAAVTPPWRFCDGHAPAAWGLGGSGARSLAGGAVLLDLRRSLPPGLRKLTLRNVQLTAGSARFLATELPHLHSLQVRPCCGRRSARSRTHHQRRNKGASTQGVTACLTADMRS